MRLDPKLLAIEGHGAVQVEEAELDRPPLIITLAGPICFWWGREWDSERHKQYVEWRDALRVALVKAGYLVYSPHRAIQGAWHPRAQKINDTAIRNSDVVIVMTPPGVPAEGTDDEVKLALRHGVRLIYAPPGSGEDLDRLLLDLGILWVRERL
jgi:hypothetical protein